MHSNMTFTDANSVTLSSNLACNRYLLKHLHNPNVKAMNNNLL